MACPERGERAGAHLGDGGGVDHGHRHARTRVEEVEQCHLGGQPGLVVADVVAHDLDSGQPEWSDVAAQDVEVAVERGIGREVDARFDHRLPAALGT